MGGQRSFPPIMKGSPAAVLGRCGLGLVALVSPHIEDGEDGRSHMPFCNLFRLCSGGSLYQRWCLDGTELAALAQDAGASRGDGRVGAGCSYAEGEAQVKNVLPSHEWAGRIEEM
eukprot:4312534-Prymnesium_polylepis.1